MLITVVIGILMTLVILIGFNGSVQSILALVGSYISYFAGPAAGAFILAMFTKRANDKGTAIGIVAGFILGFLVSKSFQVNWLWNPIIGAIITLIFGYIISVLIGKTKKDEELLEYTAMGIRKKLIKEGKEKENGISILPFSFGKSEIIVFSFFILQYVLLYFIQY